MATDKTDADIAGPERPRRPPPTIDLEPSEVSGDSVRSEKTARAWWSDRLRSPLSSALARSFLVSLAGGALAAVVLMTAMRMAGWPSADGPDPRQSAAIDDVSARLSRLESRPAPSGAPATARIDLLEASLGTLKDNLAASQKTNDAMAAGLVELKAAPRAGASVDLAPLNERLSRLEQAARTAAPNTQPADPRLRRAVAVIALDTLVRQGVPFTDILTAAKQNGVEAASLAPLEGFSTSGVPNDAALARDLQKLLTSAPPAATAKSTAPATDGSLIDRFTAGAARLVRVERIDPSSNAPTAIEDRTGIVARVQASSRANDIATAQREISRLSETDRAAFKSWLDLVARRDAALDASRKLVSSSLSAVADTAPASSASPPSKSAP